MKSLFVILLAACTFGCSAIGTYAGMDLGLGYGHNFGDNSGFSADHRSCFHSSVVEGGSFYPDDSINFNATILLRPEKE